jgi:hypothetical protein
MKIRRNAPCPCGSGKKFKVCCYGKDWERIVEGGHLVRNMSLRGKNLFFLNSVMDILHLDPTKPHIDWPSLKRRIDSDHVLQIHELLKEVWPDAADLERALKSNALAGVYSGTYTPEAIMQSVTRHSLYSDAILIFDPLVYPGSMRPEYDPVLHPESYISHTVKCLYIWLSLFQWISAGIVGFIRSPADFDRQLRWDSLIAARQSYERHPELKAAADDFVSNADIMEGDIGWLREYMMLSQPHHSIIEMLKTQGTSDDEIAEFMQWREAKKSQHPYYTGRKSEELFISTSGETHEMRRLVANMSGGFLLTDNPVHWKMIEIDRRDAGAGDSLWEPFASAMQRAPLKYLDNLRFDDCRRLRNDGLLHRMRSFLRRVWAASRTGTDFSAANAEQFAAELDEQIAIANDEWRAIDRKLLKWFAGEAAGTVAAVPAIGLANAGWLAASLCLAGAANLASAGMKRHGLANRMPGAFFLEPMRRQSKSSP